jgi:pimeloyl-ACP methyl ester carboxylesterase
MSEAVVLVHGLWMTGVDMALLRHRLRRCGFRTVQFSYPALRNNIHQNAACLNHFIARLNTDVVHLVGHSLGGLVIRQLFHEYPDQRPGRIVTLGTPHKGSLVAQRFNRYALGRMVLGRSRAPGLLGDIPPWAGQRDLGVIAGTLGIGVGRVIHGLPEPNDGTVAASETYLDGMTDHIAVHVSHTALLFSREAAQQTCAFLEQGRFNR